MGERAVICLASRSPRRQELLRQVGVNFELVDVDVDECRLLHEPGYEYVSRLAVNKAEAGIAAMNSHQPLPVLGADTAVIVDDEILGKPCDRDAGLQMLKLLSGRTHRVLTAVAVTAEKTTVMVSSSDVTFRTLTDHECAAYWGTGEPQGKAGGYAIQGLAAAFISRLEGSYSGVMGLPLYETTQLLQVAGIEVIQ